MGTSIEEHLKDCKRCTAALGGIGNVARFEADAATFDLRAGHSNRSDQRRNLKQEQARRLTNQCTVWVKSYQQQLFDRTI